MERTINSGFVLHERILLIFQLLCSGDNVSTTITINVSIIDPTSGAKTVLVKNGTIGNWLTLSLTDGDMNDGHWTYPNFDTTEISDANWNLTINATDPNDPQLGNVSLCVNVTCPGGYTFNDKQYLNLSGTLTASFQFTITPPAIGQCIATTCIDCDESKT